MRKLLSAGFSRLWKDKVFWICIGVMLVYAVLYMCNGCRQAAALPEYSYRRDRYMRSLAAAVNEQLCRLRMQRHRYQQGDAELKHAVTNIAHDLRTPLTVISGYLELLEEEEMTEAAQRYIEMIQNRAGHLAQLMEELFRYSVLLSGEQELAAEPVAVNSVLEESIAACYSLLMERGITPVIRMPQKKVIRVLDRFALARVFANLLHNAVKYSGGDLEITLSETGEVTFTAKHLLQL